MLALEIPAITANRFFGPEYDKFTQMRFLIFSLVLPF